jgi:hypothetical protein
MFRGSKAYGTAADVEVHGTAGARVDLVVYQQTHDDRTKVVANFVVEPDEVVATRRIEAVMTAADTHQPLWLTSAQTSVLAGRIRCTKCLMSSTPATRGEAHRANQHTLLKKWAGSWIKTARRARWSACLERHLLRRSRWFGNNIVRLVQRQIDIEDAARFVKCKKCGELVEAYTKSRKVARGPVCPVTVDAISEHRIYHAECSPRCQVCHEHPTFGQRCACERAKRRPCSSCKADLLKHRTVECQAPKTKDNRSGFVHLCAKCTVPCKVCKGPRSTKSQCYKCSRKAAAAPEPKKKKAKLGTGHCGCGASIDPRFAECYSCKHAKLV